jgi:hypothetical protein
MLIAIIIGILGLGAGVFCIIQVPRWQVGEFVKRNPNLNVADRFRFEDDARRTISQIVGGFFALMALILAGLRTWANDRNVRVIEQGHITDRYTKAIEQLGKLDGDKPNIEVRSGGIYALERIALDSPRDHWTIMEVLAAYVRRNAPAPDETSDEMIETHPRTDIQAILTVLGRRRRDKTRERAGQRLDLTATDLRGADLVEAHLEWADLSRAHLERALLKRAHFEDASLWRAHLGGAFLWEANLERARLGEAHLEGAILYKANLEGARTLELNQVKAARYWDRAYYSPEFRKQLGLPDPALDASGGAGDAMSTIPQDEPRG